MKYLNWKIVTLFWIINSYFIVKYSERISPIAWDACYSYRYEHQNKFTEGILIYLYIAVGLTILISDIHLYKRRISDAIAIKCLVLIITILAIFI